jgi:hypothetical protein
MLEPFSKNSQISPFHGARELICRRIGAVIQKWAGFFDQVQQKMTREGSTGVGVGHDGVSIGP